MQDLTKVTIRRGKLFKSKFLFGAPVAVRKKVNENGEMETQYFFEPSSILGIQIWEANEYGTIRQQIFILKTCAPGKNLNRLPFAKPGAEILLFGSGAATVQKVKRWLFGLSSKGIDLLTLDADYYRSAASKFRVNLEPRDLERPHGKVLELLRKGRGKDKR